MYHYKKCRWCQKNLDDKTRIKDCNDTRINGFCTYSCLDAFCDREDGRKEQRKKYY